MSSFIIKTNASQGTNVLIEDMGIYIPASGGSVTLNDDDEIQLARESSDLRYLCKDDAHGEGSHTLILNDGVDDVLETDVEAFLDSVGHDAGLTGVIKADGSVPFNAPVAGVVPTLPAHLSTKTYIDKIVVLSATDPTVNDDSGDGYRDGTYWINTATKSVWYLVDPTEGVAIWIEGAVGTSGRASFVVTLTSQNGPFREASASTYTTLGRFVYDGINVIGAATAIKANVWKASGGESAYVDVRIFDGTNSLIVAELTGISSTDEYNVSDLGDISNLPDAEATFEIQVRRSGSGNARGRCGSVVLEF
ncbi:MAG: hypothetical protein ACXABY_00325 [Candidatus Thorarchaeota archaeon]|jgi:hypothetical protein